jgi:hypothetical protein
MIGSPHPPPPPARTHTHTHCCHSSSLRGTLPRRPSSRTSSSSAPRLCWAPVRVGCACMTRLRVAWMMTRVSEPPLHTKQDFFPLTHTHTHTLSVLCRGECARRGEPRHPGAEPPPAQVSKLKNPALWVQSSRMGSSRPTTSRVPCMCCGPCPKPALNSPLPPPPKSNPSRRAMEEEQKYHWRARYISSYFDASPAAVKEVRRARADKWMEEASVRCAMGVWLA